MKKTGFILMLSMMIIMGGCMIQSGDELLKVPSPPSDYLALQNRLDAILSKGYTYSAPRSGQNRNNVQLIDIDSDGEEEAISFFRTSSNVGKFEVYLHKKIKEEYIQMGKIVGDGTDIEAVHYPKFSNSGSRGITVCWRLGPGATKGMTVALFSSDGQLKALLDTEYIDFVCTDMDGDGIDEIITIVKDEGVSKYKARFFDYDDGKIAMLYEVPLSFDIKSIHKIHLGDVISNQRAIFIESKLENAPGLITDILVFDEGGFKNMTLDVQLNSSESTYRPVTVLCDDKNKNGVLEIPYAIPMKGYTGANPSETMWLLEWREYGSNGQATHTITTFQNSSEEWQLSIPDIWVDGVTAFRKSVNNQSCTSFEVYNENGTAIPILEVYAFAGDDKEYLATLAGHFTLGMTESVIYSARIPENGKNSIFALTEDQVNERFLIMQSKWMY